jgi:hypothetical protein
MQLALNLLSPLAVGVGKQRKVGPGFRGSVHETPLAARCGGSGLGVGTGVAVSGVGLVVVDRVSGCRVGVVRLPQVSAEVKSTAHFQRNTHKRP